MALAFKRGQKELEEGGFKDALTRIHKALGKTSITLEADYEAIKTIEGEGEWYSGKKEGRNSIALRYLSEQGKSICYVVEAIAKDDLGKEALSENLDKIIMKVTDQGPKKCDMRDIKCFEVKLENKVLNITCNLDFTQYVGQSFPYDAMGKLIMKMLEPTTHLAYNREKLLLEKKMEDLSKRLNKSLGFNIEWVFPYDTMIQLDGDVIWYSEKPEPKGVVALRYLIEQGAPGIVYALEAAGKDDPGKEAMQGNITKVVMNVTDKGPKKSDMRDIKCFEVTLDSSTLQIICNLDFTQYVGQSFPYSAVGKLVEKLLEPKTFLAFNREKVILENKLNDLNKRISKSLGFELTFEIDYEPIKDLQGEAIWYSDRPEPKRAISLRYLTEQGCPGVVYAFEAVGKDDLGKEALGETYNKIVVHVTDKGPKGSKLSEISCHPAEKKGKEFHITHNLDFTQYVGQSFPYSALGKFIETTM